MTNLLSTGPHLQGIADGSHNLTPSGAEKRHRKPEGRTKKKSGNVQFPHEYNGEQLDNLGSNPLIQGQFYYLKPGPMAEVYDVLQTCDTLDICHFGYMQLELVTPDYSADDKDGFVLKMNAYRRSDLLGEITIRPKKATYRANVNASPSLVLQFLQTLNKWVDTNFTGDQDEPGKVLVPPAWQVCMGIEGVIALLNIDTLYLKLAEGILPRLEFIDGVASLGAYQLVRSNTGGIGYSEKAAVRFEGRQIGTILWGAVFPGLNETARYEITNSELYGAWNDGSFKRKIVEQLTRLLQSKVVGVFRVDICIDGPGVMTFLERVHGREIMLVRQSSYHAAKKIVGLATDEIEGFSCGSRASGRYFRCYNKTKEIQDGRKTKGANYKSYITDWQEWNGLTGTIGRLEAELLGRFLKTVDGFKWEDVLSREKMAGLFSTAMDGLFEWVPTYHTDNKINRRPRVEVVDFSAVKATPYQRSYPIPCKTDRMEKMTTKRLFVEAAFVAEDLESISLFDTANDMVERHGLQQWLSGRQDDILRTVGEIMAERNELPHYAWRRRFNVAVGDAMAYARNQKINDAHALILARATAEGFPFPTVVPATCDASTKGFPDPIKLTEGMGLVKDQPLPKTTDLQSREPGNKKGMFDGMLDGPIVSPQTMAQ